ncbi:MAG: TonB-dependent receptor [Saprospiraceae bacterium]|nr:TonB-dependent receptor [Saprospiraceae bacterium]
MLKKFLLASCMLLTVLCFGQGQQNQKINLQVDKTTIGEALKILVDEHKVNLAYDKLLPELSKQKLNLKFVNAPIESVLKTLLKSSGLSFKFVGGNFVIYQTNQGTGSSDGPGDGHNGGYFTMSGYVYDASNGETLIDATLLADNSTLGTNTNAYGYYALSLPKGKHRVELSYLGYKTSIFEIDLQSDVLKSFRLEPSGTLIDEVVVTASQLKAKEAVKNTEMSRVSIPMEVLAKTPALFGESDVIKALQLIPGIKRGGEGGLGMYIRGGNNDENLILLDEATVYNPGHLLGFLSVFNSASLKSTDVYKGAFPSVYGGRLSGILDVRMREGNDQKFSVQGGIGNIASNLTIEGPIIKEKMSFIVSARRSYLDQLVNLVIKGGFPYYFYDFNAKINYKINQRDRLYLSNYVGRDILNLGGSGTDSLGLDLGFGSDLGNTTTTMRWNHIYKNQKLFHNLTAIFSQFRYKIEGNTFDNSILIRSSIDDLGLKLDYDYTIGQGMQLKFGAQSIHHQFSPNLFVLQGGSVEDIPVKPTLRISNFENGLYSSFDKEVSPSFRYNVGLRFTSSFTKNASYFNLEPRASLRYAFTEAHAFKVGFARMNQYMHLVSGFTIALPTDLWYPSTKLGNQGKAIRSTQVILPTWAAAIKPFKFLPRRIINGCAISSNTGKAQD